MGVAAAAPGRGQGHRGGTIMSAIRVWALGLVFVVSSGSAHRSRSTASTRATKPRCRTVLKEQAYPWYDVQKDQVKPLLPDSSSWTSWLEKRLESFFDWLDPLVWQDAQARHRGRAGSSLRGVLATLLFLAAGIALAGHALATLADLYAPGVDRPGPRGTHWRRGPDRGTCPGNGHRMEPIPGLRHCAAEQSAILPGP